MRRRGIYFLLSAGIVLIAATVAALTLSGHRPPPPPKPVFPGLADHLGDLAWARVARGMTKVDFTNVAGHWVVVEKDNYPADPAKLRRLFSGLAALTLFDSAPAADRTARSRRDGIGRQDIDHGGIDSGGIDHGGIGSGGAAGREPARITLRGRVGDTIAEAAIRPAPDQAAEGGAVYIRLPGAELPSLAHGTLDLPDDPLGWLDRDIVDLPAGHIASLRLTGADGATLAIRRDGPDAAFAVAGLPGGARLKTDTGLSDLAGALAGLEFDDVKPRALVELPDSGTARAVFTTFDGLAIELRLFAHDGADWVAVAASGTGAAEAESAALNDRLARWVYAIPAARAKALRTRLDDLTEPANGL